MWMFCVKGDRLGKMGNCLVKVSSFAIGDADEGMQLCGWLDRSQHFVEKNVGFNYFFQLQISQRQAICDVEVRFQFQRRLQVIRSLLEVAFYEVDLPHQVERPEVRSILLENIFHQGLGFR